MESIIQFYQSTTLSRIFGYYDYTIESNKNSIIKVCRVGRREVYLIFTERGNDHLSVFSYSSFSVIQKVHLILELEQSPNLSTLLEIKKKIDATEKALIIPSPEKSIEIQTVIDQACSLYPLNAKDHPVLSTNQFADKVFSNGNTGFKMLLRPLLLPQQKFGPIANLIEWNDKQQWYLNSNSEGIACTVFLNENIHLFICCSPYTWLQFPLYQFSPEYLSVMVHPSVSIKALQDVFTLYKTRELDLIKLPLTKNLNENLFTFKVTCLLLNEASAGFFFTVELRDGLFCISLLYNKTPDSIKKIGSFINDWSYCYELLLINIDSEEYSIDDQTRNTLLCPTHKIKSDQFIIHQTFFQNNIDVLKLFTDVLKKHFLLPTLQFVKIA